MPTVYEMLGPLYVVATSFIWSAILIEAFTKPHLDPLIVILLAYHPLLFGIGAYFNKRINNCLGQLDRLTWNLYGSYKNHKLPQYNA